MRYGKSQQTGFNISRQSGAALLVGMVVLAAVVAFYLMGQFGARSQKHQQQDNRVEALAQAKKALIAHAVSYIDANPGEMGFLPCPDTSAAANFEGFQAGNCEAQNRNAIGRFPWKSLNISPQFDESNECLWYAVSGYYKANPKTQMLNDDTNGMLEIYDAAGVRIYGDTPQDRVVAVVIAPGSALGQVRNNDVDAIRCKGSYVEGNYLEGNGVIDNSVLNGIDDTADEFIRAGTNSDVAAQPFNDLILTITRDEIWNAVKRRKDFQIEIEELTNEIARCLTVYGNATAKKNLPWPGELDFSLAGKIYREDGSYTDIDAPVSYLGRLPNLVTASEAQLDLNASSGGTGGTGGATVIGPPNCTPCKQKYDKYLEELAEELADFRLDVLEANTDYQACLVDPGKNQVICDAELAQDLADAQTKYDQELAKIAADELADYTDCLANKSCTATGGGTAADCSGCQSDYDAAIADAVTKRDKKLNGIPGQYTSCIKKAKGDAAEIAKCDEERDENVADANEDYAEDVAEAQALYDLCTSVNSCTATGGSKGIDYVLFDPANPGAPGTCLGVTDQILWQNWKDHFFYVVSGKFAPNDTDATCTIGGQCVTVGGVNRAGVVIFSGERQPGNFRDDPVSFDANGNADADSRNNIFNYLEGTNATNYPDANGTGSYSTGAGGNDIMVCINEAGVVDGNLTSAACN